MAGLGIDTSGAQTVATTPKVKRAASGSYKGKQPEVQPTISYLVSKIDAGQAVLISDAVHCIEFPSILLPPGCTQGSVVSISCSRNITEERARADEFWDLQDDILSTFGDRSPTPPSLRLRNVTQTSVTLEWDRLQLETAKLLSLTIWRNGQRLAAIPNPLNNTSTKVSGLEVDAAYSFHLILQTTAGTFASQTIKTRTLTLTDTSGIAVCFGSVEPSELLDEAKAAVEAMRARWSNRIQIETTHFVCTHPSAASVGQQQPKVPPKDRDANEAPGVDAPNSAIEYQRAVQLSIPIVSPSWVLACLHEKKMVAISAHPVIPHQATSAPMSNRGSSSRSSVAARKDSQSHAQVPRQAKHEPIQLQNPPPPRKASIGSRDAQSQQQVHTAVAEAMPATPELPEEERDDTAVAAAVALPADGEGLKNSSTSSSLETSQTKSAENAEQQNGDGEEVLAESATAADKDIEKPEVTTPKQSQEQLADPETPSAPRAPALHDDTVDRKSLDKQVEDVNASMEDVKL